MHSFFHQANLRRYADRLDRETDPRRRAALQMLLVEEENRFGSRFERLERTRSFMVEMEARIERQKAIVGLLAEAGQDAGPAEQQLLNMSATFDLLAKYRDLLIEAIKRTPPRACPAG